MSRWPKRIGRFGLLIAGLSTGCAAGPTTGSVSPIGPDLETWTASVLAAVDEFAGRERGAKLLVDPRPIAPDFQYRDAPEHVVERVTSGVLALGVDTTTALPLSRCSGYLVPPPWKQLDECPDTNITILTFFGPPEPGEERGKWKLPMLRIEVSPSGRVMYDSDVFVAVIDDQMHFIEEVIRVVIE